MDHLRRGVQVGAGVHRYHGDGVGPQRESNRLRPVHPGQRGGDTVDRYTIEAAGVTGSPRRSNVGVGERLVVRRADDMELRRRGVLWGNNDIARLVGGARSAGTEDC